jgi:hypothetical protein
MTYSGDKGPIKVEDNRLTGNTRIVLESDAIEQGWKSYNVTGLLKANPYGANVMCIY